MLLSNQLDDELSNYLSHSLFNEADGDEGGSSGGNDANFSGSMDTDTEDLANETGGDDYQAEEPEENTTEEENTEDTTTEENTGGDDYTVDDGTGDAGGDEAATDDTAGAEDYTSDDTDEEDGNELVKKYYLSNQFSELYETVTSLYTNIQNYYNSANSFKYTDITYILNHLTKLRKDISFTLTVKFKTADYQTLITLYSFFEEEVVHLTKLVEKVIEDDLKDEQ